MHVSPGAVRITLMQIIEFRLFVQNSGNKIGRARWVLHRLPREVPVSMRVDPLRSTIKGGDFMLSESYLELEQPS